MAKSKSRSISESKFAEYGAGGKLHPYSPVDPGDLTTKTKQVFYAKGGHLDRSVVLNERSIDTGRAVHARRIEDALDWYHNHKPEQFTLPLYEGGKWLRDRYELAGRNGYRISDMDGDRVRGGRSEHDSASLGITALEEVYHALDHVGGPDLDEMLLKVVCHSIGMKEYETGRKWRAGSGLPVFRIALHRLAEHRGLIENKRLRASKAVRIRSI